MNRKILKRGRLALLSLAILGFPKNSFVDGQVGTSICACQPATYTFTFNFTQKCSDTNVAGPGINITACLTEIRGEENDENSAALVPVSVQNVQIYELDQALQVVAQTVRSGEFSDGSNFTYTSIIATLTDTLNPESLPRGIQVVSTGLNAEEQSVISTYIILYNNDCGIFPILFEGQKAGWTWFSDLGPPPQLVCPLAPALDTEAPSPIQTEAPSTPDISDAPTPVPGTTEPPVPVVTEEPTTSVAKPTCSPVISIRSKKKHPSNSKGLHSAYSKGSKSGKGKKSRKSHGASGKGSGHKNGSGSTKSDYYGRMEKISRKNSGNASKKRQLATGSKPDHPDECAEPHSGKANNSNISGSKYASKSGKGGSSMGSKASIKGKESKGKGKDVKFSKKRTKSKNKYTSNDTSDPARSTSTTSNTSDPSALRKKRSHR